MLVPATDMTPFPKLIKFKFPPFVSIELVLIPLIPCIEVLKTNNPCFKVALTGSSQASVSSKNICASPSVCVPLSISIPATSKVTPL